MRSASPVKASLSSQDHQDESGPVPNFVVNLSPGGSLPYLLSDLGPLCSSPPPHSFLTEFYLSTIQSHPCPWASLRGWGPAQEWICPILEADRHHSGSLKLYGIRLLYQPYKTTNRLHNSLQSYICSKDYS